MKHTVGKQCILWTDIKTTPNCVFLFCWTLQFSKFNNHNYKHVTKMGSNVYKFCNHI